MSNQTKFEKDDILFNQSRPLVYSKIRRLAKELAVLGKIAIAAQIAGLLLSQNCTEHGFGQMKFLNFAFEQTGDWPSTIPESALTKDTLDKLKIVPPEAMDQKKYDDIIDQMNRSQEDLALFLNIAVVLCELQGKTYVEEIKQDAKVSQRLRRSRNRFIIVSVLSDNTVRYGLS